MDGENVSVKDESSASASTSHLVCLLHQCSHARLVLNVKQSNIGESFESDGSGSQRVDYASGWAPGKENTHCVGRMDGSSLDRV